MSFLEKAQSLLQEGYYEDAVGAFSLCIGFNPDEAAAYYGRAVAHFQLKNWSGAAADFTKSTKRDPLHLDSWVGQAMSLAMDNKIYEAIAAFELLLKDHPKYVRGHLQLGLLYYRLGLIPKGHEEMELALASRPSLSERQLIQDSLKEQKTLDKRRYYKPDFEALNKKKSEPPPER